MADFKISSRSLRSLVIGLAPFQVIYKRILAKKLCKNSIPTSDPLLGQPFWTYVTDIDIC